jgi:hypothetical protein
MRGAMRRGVSRSRIHRRPLAVMRRYCIAGASVCSLALPTVRDVMVERDVDHVDHAVARPGTGSGYGVTE